MHVADMGEKRNTYRPLRRSRHTCKMILKCVFSKGDIRAWSAFIWLRIRG
jgi:hypothetical protein